MLLLQKIRLSQFRCFEKLTIEITHPIVVITGCNGSGKTSLLEAIYCCSFSKSFRISDSSILKNHHAEGFAIELEGLDNQGDSWNIKRIEHKEKKNFFINNKRAATYKQVFSTFRTIAMSEEDLTIIHGSPENRRTFLDKAIALHEGDYIELLQQQKKIIAQKQALLRSQNPQKCVFELFNEKQQDLDTLIRKKRIEYGQKLIQESLSINSNIQIINSEIRFKYESFQTTDSFTIEKQAGRVLSGSHKDNPQILLNDESSRYFASRGQQKALLTLLKLGQIHLLNKPCILLIDDYLTDLDKDKAKQILKILSKQQIQIFIASPMIDTANELIKEFSHQMIRL